MSGWARYVAAYHDAHPGITEELLAAARDGAGRSPYDWLLEAVPAEGTVVDLACGSAPVLRRLAGRPAVGVDRSVAELSRARRSSSPAVLVRADAGALPLASGRADAATASMALMVLDPLARVLAEVARVLRPGGRLVATVPIRTPPGAGHPGSVSLLGEVLVRLGQASVPYPEPIDRASAPRRLAAAGLHLIEDVQRRFVRAVADEADAELTVRSFYAPGATAAQISEAIGLLQGKVRREPVELSYRIRRLVAVAGSGPG